MTLYSSDSRFLVWGDNSAPVDEVLADSELSWKRKTADELLLREKKSGEKRMCCCLT